MTIFNKIKEKQAEITKKIMLLELDSRFNKLVRVLKQKQIKIDETFLNKTDKQEFDWQKYYADLCLFLEQDIMVVVNLYNHHKEDELSIYDDSTKEINQELLSKEVEIKKCIQDTDDNYHDEVLTNYIKTKYEMIMNKFKNDLTDVLKRNEITLINNLKDDYQEVTPLTVYNNATLVKQRYLDELSSVLDDFINYVNSLIENKKIITEKEQLIEETIRKINNLELLAEFNNIKNNYYESIIHINSIDTKISMLQKEYFRKLDEFYEDVKRLEEIFDKNVRVMDYFNYLKETDPVKIEFSKLSEIKGYLQNNNNYELQKLLNRAYYEVIKLEVRYTNGASYLYSKLDEEMRLDLELLFLEDIKNNQELLINSNCLEEFLTSDFSLDLLTKYTEIIMLEQVSELVEKYKDDLLNKMECQQKGNLKELIEFNCDKLKFDDNGDAFIQTYHDNPKFFVVNRNGRCHELDISAKNFKMDSIDDIKYHDGFVTCLGYIRRMHHTGYVQKIHKTYYLVIYDLINNHVYDVKISDGYKKIEAIHEYSDGLVCVEYKDDKYKYFYDINGKLKLKIEKLVGMDNRFNNGYLLVHGVRELCYYNKNGRVVYKEKTDLDFSTEYIYLKTPQPFNNGLTVIEWNAAPSLTEFFDTDFDPVLKNYQYLKYEVIDPDNHKYLLPYFKHKTDGSTYVWNKDGLIKMDVLDLAGYYLIENYVLGRDYEGKIRFVSKENSQNNSFLDILGKICTRSGLTNQLNDYESQHIPFRILVANDQNDQVTSRLVSAFASMEAADELFSKTQERIYNNSSKSTSAKNKEQIPHELSDSSNILTIQEVHKNFDKLITLNDHEHRLVLKR